VRAWTPTESGTAVWTLQLCLVRLPIAGSAPTGIPGCEVCRVDGRSPRFRLSAAFRWEQCDLVGDLVVEPSREGHRVVRETLDDLAEVRIVSEFIEVLPSRTMTLVPLEPRVGLRGQG
jgi:hypothetical protein